MRILIFKEGDAKEHSSCRTNALVSQASKGMLKVGQQSSTYRQQEMTDVPAATDTIIKTASTIATATAITTTNLLSETLSYLIHNCWGDILITSILERRNLRF